MKEKEHLKIQLDGRQLSLAERMVLFVFWIAACFGLFWLNNTFLFGHWAIHLFIGVLGFAAIGSVSLKLMPTQTMHFDNVDEAIAYLEAKRGNQ